MTAEQFSWKKISKVEFTKYLNMAPKELPKEGLETVPWSYFVIFLNQIESSIEMNIIYKI